MSDGDTGGGTNEDLFRACYEWALFGLYLHGLVWALSRSDYGWAAFAAVFGALAFYDGRRLARRFRR